MNVIYDTENDVLRILLGDAPIEASDEAQTGIILDYDRDGNLVGLEILTRLSEWTRRQLLVDRRDLRRRGRSMPWIADGSPASGDPALVWT